MEKKTLVIGASDNPSRYSYLAVQRLRKNGHPVVAIGKKNIIVGDVNVINQKLPFANIDTITLYINPVHQKEYNDNIVSLKPKRLIYNPAAENNELADMTKKNSIQPLEACTLVMLATGQY